MNDRTQNIELYEDNAGNHYVRVGSRIAHLGHALISQTDGTDESISAKFRDHVQAVHEGWWDLGDWESDGGKVESFDQWEQRTHYDEDGYAFQSSPVPKDGRCSTCHSMLWRTQLQARFRGPALAASSCALHG